MRPHNSLCRFFKKKLVIIKIFNISLQKFNNKTEKLSMAQAKAEATNDERYKKVRVTLRERKHVFLYYKSLAKNGHSYCENLKQLTINDIAISKLSK